MQNGNGVTNGAAPGGAAPVQINPAQAAAFGLQFLSRVSHTKGERESYDVAEALLSAIMNGQVVLAPPARAANETERPVPAPPPPPPPEPPPNV